MRDNMINVFIADMDGTFLRHDHTYDFEQFEIMMTKLKTQNKHFVIASGNQWRQIRSFFKGYEQDISIVGENGGVILHHDKVVNSIHFSNSTLEMLLDYLKTIPAVYVCSGIQHSYVLNSYPQNVKDFIALYSRNTQYVDEYIVGEDPILKIALVCEPEVTHSLMEGIQHRFFDVSVHSSGLGVIDINPLGVNKGEGLEHLLQLMNRTLSECMAFGDGGNDIPMLERVASPKVVSNAPEWMHVYGELVPSNQEQGVITTILEELSRYE